MLPYFRDKLCICDLGVSKVCVVYWLSSGTIVFNVEGPFVFRHFTVEIYNAIFMGSVKNLKR